MDNLLKSAIWLHYVAPPAPDRFFQPLVVAQLANRRFGNPICNHVACRFVLLRRPSLALLVSPSFAASKHPAGDFRFSSAARACSSCHLKCVVDPWFISLLDQTRMLGYG
jgi:hypothetical protein